MPTVTQKITHRQVNAKVATRPQTIKTSENSDAVEQHLRLLFSETAFRLARETGFVRRQSAITGSAFAQTLIFGFLSDPEATYTRLQHILGFQQVQVSKQAIEKRMTQRAAAFMQRLFEAFVGLAISTEPVAVEVLRRFEGVYLQDGSSISLPQQLHEHWRGCSNPDQPTQRSGMQLQVRLNLSTGQMQGPFVQADHKSEVKGVLAMEQTPIPVGGLWLVDMGWFAIPVMQRMSQQGRLWLTYAKSDLTMADEDGVRISLPQLMAKHKHEQVVDVQVKVGTQQMPARLIAFQISKPEAQRRRKQINKRGKTRGKGCRRDVRVGKRHQRPSMDGRKRSSGGKKRYALADWTILLTNVPAEQLSPQEARVLLRARWQIELLWKLWKERGQLDIWRSEKPWRVLCEIFAKLMGLLVQHWLTVIGCWSDPHRSVVRASDAVQASAVCFLFALQGGIEMSWLIERVCSSMHQDTIETRRKQPNTSQRLVDPSLHRLG